MSEQETLSVKEDQTEEKCTKQRFEEEYNHCVKVYDEWVKNELDSETRRNLRRSLREISRVIARMEIEMALSESAERAKNPIPVPPHRSTKKGATTHILEGRKVENERPNKKNNRNNNKNNNNSSKGKGRGRGKKPSDETVDDLPGFVKGENKSKKTDSKTKKASPKSKKSDNKKSEE